MATYRVNGNLAAVTTSYKTALTLLGGTSVRPKLKEVIFGATSAADKALEWLLQRLTADGTGTAVTPKPVDPADVASRCTAKYNYSAEPTYTSGENMVNPGSHQKLSWIWQALDSDSRIVVPASSGAGLGMQIKSSDATPQVNVGFAWDE